MKARDTVRTGFLRYWIAPVDPGHRRRDVRRRRRQEDRGVLKEAKSGMTTFTPEELALIRDWVPPHDPGADRRDPGAGGRPDQGRPQGGHGDGHRDEGPGRPAGR